MGLSLWGLTLTPCGQGHTGVAVWCGRLPAGVADFPSSTGGDPKCQREGQSVSRGHTGAWLCTQHPKELRAGSPRDVHTYGSNIYNTEGVEVTQTSATCGTSIQQNLTHPSRGSSDTCYRTDEPGGRYMASASHSTTHIVRSYS